MRKIPLVIGGGIGATIAYLLDPDLGRSRRARLADQLAARGRRAISKLSGSAEYQMGRARGMVHEAVASSRGPKTFDEDTLLQKVRSEAIGPWRIGAAQPHDVEVEIDGDRVTIEGRVASPAERERLREMVSNVEGVEQVEDALVVLR
jgi:hypothetical protein